VTSYDDPDKDTIVMVSALVAILISVAIANRGFEINHFHIHLSPILLPMVVGITFANTSTYKAKHEIEHTVDLIESPLMIAFFAVIGAEIVILVAEQLLVMEWLNLLIFTLVYVGFRIFGKLFGSWLGAKMAHSDPVIQKYLGLCLLPQAQAAIGLAFIAQGLLSFTVYGNLILVITLVATVIYELFAPVGLRFALVRCNEADDAVCSLLDQQHKKPFFRFTKAH
jgi:Kef-type K+ transport systems, membrane components